jgi:outer membrane murein-binding lipoprotein Lpp
MRPWVLPFVAGATAVALVATSATAVVQWRRAAEAEQRLDELTQEVAELRAQVDRLEEDLEAAREADPLLDLLRGLLGDDVGALADLLGELFGGELGDLGDLFGGDLGDLFGDLGDLGGLLEGASGIPGAACLQPAAGDGLFGGLFDRRQPVPDDPDELVEVIAAQVAEMRELDWQEEAEVDFLDDQAIRERLDELTAANADPDEVAIDQRLLVALGAIPPGTDLLELQRELLGAAVAGFYVSETGELVVRVPGDGTIRPMDRVTLAHELEHALADQTLGLPDLDAIDDRDARLGALAVVEGDATLLMHLWALEHLSVSEQLGLGLGEDVRAAQEQLAETPHFVRRQLLFPYTEGLDLVCALYLEGGWAAVDAAYHDLPTTSAEVVHPDRAGRAPAATATLHGPAGYAEARTDSFGLAPLTWLFEAPGGDPGRGLSAPAARAASWAGGEVTVWTAGNATAVGLALVDGGGGPPLCGSVTDWYDAAFPDADRRRAEGATVFASRDATAVVVCDDADVLFATAPDLTTATRIVGGG